jgi:NAD(P)-dependent dehydrogenase (short-subunit alcohol dehydrogenase family)
MDHPTDRPATWFVTGTSRGLGLALVRHLLGRGDRVAATTRSRSRLLAALDGVGTEGLLALEVELTDEDAVRSAVEQAVARFGGIDVVVNNAGYGFLGAIEETSDADVRRMFDVQINGTWNVLRAVLPHLREARAGRIINVSSILGLTSFPGWGLYCAGKYALEGLTESLAAEVSDLGITVHLVEPGYFDTDFLTRHSLALPASTTEAHLQMPGSQPGDPDKAAAAMVAIATRDGGPFRQQLGADSAGLAQAKVDALAADVAAGREFALTTDYAR